MTISLDSGNSKIIKLKKCVKFSLKYVQIKKNKT